MIAGCPSSSGLCQWRGGDESTEGFLGQDWTRDGKETDWEIGILAKCVLGLHACNGPDFCCCLLDGWTFSCWHNIGSLTQDIDIRVGEFSSDI